ncbi:MAG: oligoendopeptidase F family protein [Anaerolineales bacterium]|nr:oligoendopeptidase F family protein [Anaerolineales bacterium]
MTENSGLLRKDAPPESVWAGKEVFPTWGDWEAEFEAVQASLPNLARFAGNLLDDPATLVEWMEVTNDLSLRVGRLGMFARFAATVDGTDIEAKTAIGQASGLAAAYKGATSFALPEMLSDAEKLLKWSEEVPDLGLYAHYFRNQVRQQENLRSAEVEEVLSGLGPSFDAVYQTFTELVNSDLVFEDARDSEGNRYAIKQSTLSSSLQSPDRERRRTAWENYLDGYKAMENTLAANYIAWIRQQVFLARVRGYSSVLEMRLAPFNVPLEMFHNLIDTFKDNLPLWHRYWDVRRRALGLDEIRPYDLWAPIGKHPPQIAYQQAVEWICGALEPMGEEYVPVTRKGALEDRWVDWAPNIEKRQGAASWRRFLMKPWIFMSYNDSVFSMSTLAHELGHSIHTYLASENQPEVYFGFGALSSTVAETASNFNQVLTRAYLRDVKKEDPDFMISMVEEAMSNFHRYFFIMPTLARFELEVFSRAEEGKPLSVKVFNQIMQEMFAEGYGETLKDDPARTGLTWATFLHLYMPFYTFQYAIGISAAHAVGEKVLAGDVAARENYLQFLKAGGSRYTMDLFDLAGVDMTSPEVVCSAFKVMEENIDLMEKLAGA